MAEQDRTPPPDGFHWFQDGDGRLEVVQVAEGMMMHTGTDQHSRLASWPARDGGWPGVLDGRLLGRIPEPGPVARMIFPITEENGQPATLQMRLGPSMPPADVPGMLDSLRRLEADDAEQAEPTPIDHADLLRRYVALVVAAEGSDFLSRLGDGPTAGVTFTPEELAHLKALSAAANDGSAS